MNSQMIQKIIVMEVFSIISILFSLITVFIIRIFTLFWKSPIVRANNQNLSFVLLTSLMFSLLCVFLFIGRPVDITCMLRQIFFGIFFTVVVSSVLAKTIIVCIAFKATRPDSSWRKCLGVKLPYSVVLVCSSLQILNAVIWLSLSPPYQELNLDYPGKIIIQCNEGSVFAFYLMLSYMGFLAAVSFVLAFMLSLKPSFDDYKYYKHGDIIIGGIFTVNFNMDEFQTETHEKIMWCNGHFPFNYKYFLNFQFAIEEVNKNRNILPNVTLGFHVYDSCSNANKAVKSTIKILSGPGATVPNYYCTGEEDIAGFIGDLVSVTTVPIAQILNVYGYTQISYGATDPMFSDRVVYPYLFRTARSDHVYVSALLAVLKHFSWNWVGIIATADDSGEKESKSVSSILNSQGICIEFTVKVFLLTVANSEDTKMKTMNKKSRDIISRSSAKIIIICGTYSFSILEIFDLPDNVLNTKTFFLPPNWFVNGEILHHFYKAVNCSLGFEVLMNDDLEQNSSQELLRDPYNTKNMKEFLCNIHPSNYPDDKWLEDIWIFGFGCLSPNDVKNKAFQAVFCMKLHKCSGKENITVLPLILNNDGSTVAYNALISMAYALNALHKSLGREASAKYMTKFSYRHKIPSSQCSENCPPGSRKVKNDVKPICCYDCVICPEGEISNTTDSEKCLKCLDTEFSNSKRDHCIPKLEDFLSFSDGLSIALSSIALLFWTISVLILGIFVSHKNSPIVKANNKDLSFILLISLSLCFLCVFLFIGRPVDRTCKLRQIVFGIIFSISVSSILAKTITVYTAFKISRPGNRWRKLIGIKMSNSIVVLASAIEVIISIIWLYFSPPYLEQDTHSYQRRIIIQCNEGSQVAFFAILGYLFFLTAISFTLAYLARTLPDRFNEAKYITFSMLVFCSVWITMVPSYLSTKGKNMVAVEIFSILASSAGLLSFIFFPKCYIILVKPQLNTKSRVHIGQ
ncbi:G-protein coupled receptor family C group 6 member A-like [Hyla sarda]|uniref:G-protein coupled receptor family C group 6 member A-like n=1 Tax=Hyla sarda TaxID=327740 RepID=UPI0024C45E65|nr:G-protein coupled receptor family C group 6 member A-like [Hyla sarda]